MKKNITGLNNVMLYDTYGLKDELLDQIKTLITAFPEIKEALLVGSRAKRDAKGRF